MHKYEQNNKFLINPDKSKSCEILDLKNKLEDYKKEKLNAEYELFNVNKKLERTEYDLNERECDLYDTEEELNIRKYELELENIYNEYESWCAKDENEANIVGYKVEKRKLEDKISDYEKKLKDAKEKSHYKTKKALNELETTLPIIVKTAMSYVLERMPDGQKLKDAKRRSQNNLKSDLAVSNNSLAKKFFDALPEEYRATGGASKGLRPPK